MKTHTSQFKEQIKKLGRELDSQITYTLNNEEVVLGKEQLNAITPHYKGDILKSVMKQLDIDSNVNIPVGTEVNYKFGVLVNGEYEYLDYGNYIVYSSEKQEDTRSYKIVAYDKMLYAMKDYEKIENKNLFVYPYADTTTTLNEITFTDNGDGSITINGTATAQTIFYIKRNPWGYDESDIIENGTYTISLKSYSTNIFLGCNFYDTNNQSAYYRTYSNDGTTFTISDVRSISNPRIVVNSGTVVDNLTVYPQLEVGNNASNYVPYFKYPATLKNYLWNLCDSIGLSFKNTNFVNYDKEIVNELYLDSEGKSLGYTYRDVLDEIAGATASTICINEDDELEVRYVNNNYGEQLDFEILGSTSQDGTPTSTNPIKIKTKTGFINEEIDSNNYVINIGNIELCKLGNYKDRIYKSNNKWYLEKNTNKLILDGSENYWVRSGETTSDYFVGAFNLQTSGTNSKFGDGGTWLSNRFTYGGLGVNNRFSTYNGNAQTGYGFLGLTISTSLANDLTSFKNWLSNNNVIVYYILRTPTTTEITDTSLLNQLNNIRTFDEVDEEYLKDINVNFGEKYGPVNSVVFSRSAESDNIYRQDEDSIEENGLHEIKIIDNQILNSNSRDSFIDGVFSQLNGFTYYANDFSSTGIAYYDLCDRYNVKVDDNIYSCIMMNDELDITQGLEEKVHLDIPEKSETDYKKADTTDRRINQAYLIVNKQESTIEGLVSKTQILDNGVYTKEQVDNLLIDSQTGLTNTFSEAGGNNIFRNTGLWFTTTDEDNPYEFWSGVVTKQKEENASNMSALLLQNSNLIQEQVVPNGYYTISFRYKKLITLSNPKVYINDIQYDLSEEEDTEFVQIIEVSSQHINIKFTCDVNNGCEVYELMINAGQVKLAYSQNQNETTTDTVNISKGITITSSANEDIKFKADFDGIRTLDRNNNVITKFTDTGMTTEQAIIKDKSQIVGTVWQEVGEQTWITRL